MQTAGIALVTGATGFIGSALVERLLREGFEVRALTSGSADTQKISSIYDRIRWFPVSNDGIVAAIPGVTHFFNFAVIYDRPQFSDELIHEVNVALPLRILSALKTSKIPVVCILGDSFYRKYPYNFTAQERYTRSKDMFAKSVWSLMDGGDNRFALLLIEQVYGPGESLDKAYPRVIKELLANASRIPLTHGNQRRDFIHISDVIDAVMLIARSHWLGVVEVGCGSGASTSVRSVFVRLKDLTHSTSVLGFGDLPSDQSISDSIANINWLKKQGWLCKISLESGLIDFVSGIRRRLIEIKS